MNNENTEDLIRYDLMMQEALLGVVRKIMHDASRFGLPGEHHFYVTFNSQAPGVRLSNRLREKHPEEMTIVLQHQFWDFVVNDEGFEVGLSFGGVAERLLVPFNALTGFYDPSVQFGLKFTQEEPKNAQTGKTWLEDATVIDGLDAITRHEQKNKERAFKNETRTTIQAEDELLEEADTSPVEEKNPEDTKIVDFSSFKKKK